ncbi:DUF485 domain-containing protein [Nigerium massiliense]|uniref:DUF485 domain-containing protein n=1 Tax=Nigerium massiliense TaxID=1522317 RepID=UPI000A652217|nr:DUF485 domain-containing protein [Nigerium massiliense]
MTTPDHERHTAPERGSHSADHVPQHVDGSSDYHTYDTERHLPASHSPLPALNHVGGEERGIPADAFVAVQNSEDFATLRRRFRRFAFPMTAAFLIWYFAYVLLSVFAKDFMATPVIGHINLGILLGLLQFVTTFLITWLYIRHMNKSIDPIASKLRSDLQETAR